MNRDSWKVSQIGYHHKDSSWNIQMIPVDLIALILTTPTPGALLRAKVPYTVMGFDEQQSPGAHDEYTSIATYYLLVSLAGN
eukprot:scaffold50044_cov45-Attheya_sp.AAC.1